MLQSVLVWRFTMFMVRTECDVITLELELNNIYIIIYKYIYFSSCK